MWCVVVFLLLVSELCVSTSDTQPETMCTTSIKLSHTETETTKQQLNEQRVRFFSSWVLHYSTLFYNILQYSYNRAIGDRWRDPSTLNVTRLYSLERERDTFMLVPFSLKLQTDTCCGDFLWASSFEIWTLWVVDAPKEVSTPANNNNNDNITNSSSGYATSAPNATSALRVTHCIIAYDS